jgi:Family of unknown function (DUF5317)
MILFLAVALTAFSVVVTGGSLGQLARLKWKVLWALIAAVGVQGLIIEVIPRQVAGWPGGALQLASYAMAVVFLIANRHIPWLWLLGLGGLSNLLAIGANRGVMPASPVALRAAGIVVPKGEFLNSMSMRGAHLAFLGDVFSIPRGWPFADVFSAGDVVLVAGAFLLLHWVCGSRLAQAAGQLRRHRTGTLAAGADGD